MTTYTNRTDVDEVWIPSEFKLNINMPEIDGWKMNEVNFTCGFYTNKKSKVTLTKSEMIMVDENNFVAPLDSSILGNGTLVVEYEAQIPDFDFTDRYRTEFLVVPTKLQIK